MRTLRNILVPYVWLLVGSLLLVACSPSAPAPSGGPAAASPSQPKAGGILNVGEPRDIINLDPWRSGSIQDLDKAAPSMNGIVQYDPLQNDKVVGDLAERWEVSPDGKVYTFYFHKNVKWHDGKPFSAEDVKYTMDRALTPPKNITISSRRGLFTNIDKMEVVDKDTLRMTLKNPQPSILALLAIGWHLIVPKHILEPKGGDMENKVMGTGPYKFVDYTVGVSYTVTKNPDYFKPGRPYLDGVKQYILTDDNARVAALRAKQIDLVFNFPGLTARQAETVKQASNDLVVEYTPTLIGNDNLVLNVQSKPLSDVRVRKALSLAIDRRQAIKLARQGLGQLGGTMAPWGNWALPEAELLKHPGWREDKTQDIADAKKLLADAGYANGFKLVNLVRTGQTDEDMAVFLKQEFAKVGVELELKLVESAVRSDLTTRGEFDTYNVTDNLSTDDPDEMFLGKFYSPIFTNAFTLKDETLDKMIEAQSREMDVAKRKAQILDIQRRILDTFPRIIIAWPVRPAAFWNYVKDWKNPASTYNNVKFQDVWLAK